MYNGRKERSMNEHFYMNSFIRRKKHCKNLNKLNKILHRIWKGNELTEKVAVLSKIPHESHTIAANSFGFH